METGNSQNTKPTSKGTILESALTHLRRIVLEELGDLGTTVYLFGSAARGRMARFSDIDIAVETETDPPTGRIARLRERIAESKIPYHVDVFLLNELEPAFKRRAVREGERWIG